MVRDSRARSSAIECSVVRPLNVRWFGQCDDDGRVLAGVDQVHDSLGDAFHIFVAQSFRHRCLLVVVPTLVPAHGCERFGQAVDRQVFGGYARKWGIWRTLEESNSV